MSAALAISRFIDALNERIGRTVAWAIIAAIVISAGNAVARRAFDVSSNAWLEIQWYLFGAVFMLCAAWTLRLNEHIRIDVLSAVMSARGRSVVDLVGHLFFLMPFVVLMLVLSIPFVASALSSDEMSPNPGGLPIWPAKALVVLGFLSLTLQALSELIKRVAIMSGRLGDASDASHGAGAEAERLLQDLAPPPQP